MKNFAKIFVILMIFSSAAFAAEDSSGCTKPSGNAAVATSGGSGGSGGPAPVVAKPAG